MALRLYLHSPKKVFVAQVDLGGLPAYYPQNQIPFKNVSFGSYANVRPGMTIRLGTAPEKDDLGRIRYLGIFPEEVYEDTVMVTGRFSEGTNDGEAVLIEDSYITVYEEYRVWSKVPMMVGAVIFKDGYYNAFANVDKPPPVANGGTGVAGTADSVTNLLTVTFNGAASFMFIHSPAIISGVTNYQWDLQDGTVVGGALNSVEVTATFPIGFRYIYLTVKGETGTESHTCQVPVYVSQPGHINDESISSFQVISHSHNRIGQEIAIDFMENLPRDVYPDGCLMMMWDDEISVTPSQRHNIQFIGWHYRDEAYIRAENTGTMHGTQMVFYDVCKKLESLPGWSMTLEYQFGVPAVAWSTTKFPNALYYLWFILYWHSTAVEVADFIYYYTGNLGLMFFIAMASDRANLHAQVNDLSMAMLPDHILTCSRQGQMRIVIDLNIEQVIPGRPSPDDPADVWATWDDSYWTEIHFTYIRSPRVNQTLTRAIVATQLYDLVGGIQMIPTVACVAPGDAPGQGEQFIQNNERMVWGTIGASTDFDVKYQDVLNNLCIYEGNRYARFNSRYTNFQITIPWEKLDIS